MNTNSRTKPTSSDLLIGMLCVESDHKLLYNCNRIMIVLNKRKQNIQEIPGRFQGLLDRISFVEGGLGPWSREIDNALVNLGFHKGIGWTCGDRPDYLYLEANQVSSTLDMPGLRNLTDEERAFLAELAREVNNL